MTRSPFWVEPSRLPPELTAAFPPEAASGEDVRAFDWEGRPALLAMPAGADSADAMLGWVSNDNGASWSPVDPMEIGRDAKLGDARSIGFDSLAARMMGPRSSSESDYSAT